MLGGLPGAGKTTLSRALHERHGFVHLNSVYMRRRMGLCSEDTPREIGDPQVFSRMDAEARHALREHQGVLYDASHNTFVVRERSRRLAAEVGAQALFLWVDAPMEIAVQRATLRNDDLYTKRLDAAVVAGYYFEQPVEGESSIRIDATEPLSAQILSFEEQLIWQR